MNKQSNTYTIIYASVMVIVVAAVLAFTALALKPIQQNNIEVDKKSQILNSVKIASTAKDAATLYQKYITESFVVDDAGEKVDGDAFTIDIAVQSKLPAAERKLPVFVATLDGGVKKYILPMYGAGLWGPIWGYVSIDSDGNTVYGAYFSHQGETPGLGAEIGTEPFLKQYSGKHLFVGGVFKSIAVEKAGQTPLDGAEFVDAISGGTITSKGVQAMMLNCVAPYQNFLKTLK